MTAHALSWDTIRDLLEDTDTDVVFDSLKSMGILPCHKDQANIGGDVYQVTYPGNPRGEGVRVHVEVARISR